MSNLDLRIQELRSALAERDKRIAELEAELLDTRRTLAMNTEERDIERCNRIETEKRIAELEDKYAGASATIERLEGERSVRTGRIAELEDKLMRAQFDVYPPGKVSRIARLEGALGELLNMLRERPNMSRFQAAIDSARQALADKGDG